MAEVPRDSESRRRRAQPAVQRISRLGTRVFPLFNWFGLVCVCREAKKIFFLNQNEIWNINNFLIKCSNASLKAILEIFKLVFLVVLNINT